MKNKYKKQGKISAFFVFIDMTKIIIIIYILSWSVFNIYYFFKKKGKYYGRNYKKIIKKS